MSVVSNLITELEKEDELQRKLNEEHFLQQKKKYEEITALITHYKG